MDVINELIAYLSQKEHSELDAPILRQNDIMCY